MSEAQRGTYVRERDGALHLYHSPVTSFNFPQTALTDYLSGKNRSSLNEWRHVTDPDEIQAVRDYFGSHLSAGEYGEVT